jgi:hypothetical protein
MERAADHEGKTAASACADAVIRAILAGTGEAAIGERLDASFEELSQTALRVKKERDLAVSAVKMARLALHEPDPESRLAAAQLLEAALCFIGEAV